MFSLVTDKATVEQLDDSLSNVTTYAVPSWGKEMTAFTFISKEFVKIGGQNLSLHAVTYMEGAQHSQIDRMRAMGIGGLIGNVLFVDRVLILDTKQQRFGFMQ